MDSSTFLKKGIVGLVLLVTIGLLSLAVTFSRMPASQIIINAGVIRSSSFALSFYDTTGNLLFSVSPQNDYFYTNSVKDHLEDKISASSNGNFLQNVWTSLRSLVFNQKELIWNTVGSSANGQESVNYTVNQVNGGVEIQRAVAAKSIIKSLGQVLQFCARTPGATASRQVASMVAEMIRFIICNSSFESGAHGGPPCSPASQNAIIPSEST